MPSVACRGAALALAAAMALAGCAGSGDGASGAASTTGLLRGVVVDEERAGESDGTFGTIQGLSPLVLPVERQAMVDAGVGTGGVGLMPGVYSGWDDAHPGTVTVQQRLTLYTTAFFGYLPPEGWSFIATGQVPPPA